MQRGLRVSGALNRVGSRHIQNTRCARRQWGRSAKRQKGRYRLSIKKIAECSHQAKARGQQEGSNGRIARPRPAQPDLTRELSTRTRVSSGGTQPLERSPPPHRTATPPKKKRPIIPDLNGTHNYQGNGSAFQSGGEKGRRNTDKVRSIATRVRARNGREHRLDGEAITALRGAMATRPIAARTMPRAGSRVREPR